MLCAFLVQHFLVALTCKLHEVCFIRLEESVEKAPDHKKASKPAKTKLELKETPIRPPEAGSIFHMLC